MKTGNQYLRIILLFCFVVIISCSEENYLESSSIKYHGTWLWFRTVGGIFPKVFTPEEGTTIKVNFNKQGIFKIFRNDSLKVIANYKVEALEHNRDKISYFNVVTNNFYFNSRTDYVQIKKDTLEIWDGMFDGYFSFYKKIN